MKSVEGVGLVRLHLHASLHTLRGGSSAGSTPEQHEDFSHFAPVLLLLLLSYLITLANLIKYMLIRIDFDFNLN